jgi:hypothetical protein
MIDEGVGNMTFMRLTNRSSMQPDFYQRLAVHPQRFTAAAQRMQNTVYIPPESQLRTAFANCSFADLGKQTR